MAKGVDESEGQVVEGELMGFEVAAIVALGYEIEDANRPCGGGAPDPEDTVRLWAELEARHLTDAQVKQGADAIRREWDL